MSPLATSLVESLQIHLPDYPLSDLTAAVEALLAGAPTRLDANQIHVTFGDAATLTNCTIAVGNTTYTLNLPEPPDHLNAALIHYASLPLDTVPNVRSTAIPAGSHLPFAPLSTFCGRIAELRQLAVALSETRTTALVPVIAYGIMGMGKTSLALEFAHRYGAYFHGGVVWVDCADVTNLPMIIAQCGRSMGLYTEIADVDAAVAQVRYAWQAPIPRLLIFDNCEDPQIVARYAPTSGGSRVLVTTRRAQWSRCPTIRVGTLPRIDSVALIQMLAPQVSSNEADALAEYGGDLPLGLHLIGSYLGHYRPTVTDYLMRLDVKHQTFTGRGVQIPAFEMPGRREINLITIITHAMEQLGDYDNEAFLARQIIDALCHLAPGEIVPYDLLSACLSGTPEADDVTDSRTRLVNLGLVESLGGAACRIHRLVDAVLHSSFATEAGSSRAEIAVNAALVELERTGHPFARPEIVVHGAWMVDHAQSRLDDSIMQLRMNLAGLYYQQGRYTQAESLYAQVLAVQEQVLGAEHVDTATSLNNLAGIYYQQGRYEAAAPLYARALAIQERVLGAEHPDVATSLNNLAGLHYQQGRYEEAEPLYVRVLALRERVLGAEHADTTTSVNNLALLYADQGRYREAEPLYKRAIVLSARVLGAQHPKTAMSLNNLALLYYQQGQYEHAESLYKRALAIKERVLGAQHPETAKGLNNLALVYADQGRYGDAETLYKRALVVYVQTLGAQHPETAMSLNNLACLYADQGRYGEAEPLYQRAMHSLEATLGPDHPTTRTVTEGWRMIRAFIETISDSGDGRQ